MTDLDDVLEQLEALKGCPRLDIPSHFAPLLRRIRFVPGAERRPHAEEFARWTGANPGAAPVKRGYALFLLALDRFMSDDFEPTLRLLVEAREVFAKLDEREGVGLCAMLVGATYRTLGHFDLALKTLWEGHELLKTSGRYPVMLAANANSIANIDLELGHRDEALAMFNLAFDESTRADDFYFMIYALHGLGKVYLQQNKRVAAAEMLQKALQIAEQHEHPLHISNSLTELAALRLALGELSESEALNRRALDIRESNHFQAGAITSCIRLAELRARQGDFTEALAVLQRGLAIAEELRVKLKISQVHQALADVHERMGDNTAALTHYKRFHALREEVEREDRARQLADAKVIFEAEQTKKENATIKSQKAEIERQNAELHETIDELTRARISRKARAFTLVIAILLFVFNDAILGTALKLLASDNYFALLAVKIAIIFSLAPINRGIERYLFRRVSRSAARTVSSTSWPPSPPLSTSSIASATRRS